MNSNHWREMRSIEIGRIQKSKSTSIVFKIVEIEDKFFVNIREYVKTSKFSGFTKKGYVFEIKHLNNIINSLNEMLNFVSGKEWSKKFNEIYDAQISSGKAENEIIDKIYRYLNNQEKGMPTESEIVKWVKYCYDSKQYKLAIKIFDSIDEQKFPDDEYKKLKKIAEICRLKSE